MDPHSGGGCELLLACDLAYATDRATFGQIEVRGGVLPGFGGTWRLPRRVGSHRARELMFTGAIVSATRAKEIGLVLDVVAPDELLSHCRSVARQIAANGPLGVAAAKQLAIAGEALSLQAANAIERQVFASLFGTADQKEGMTAFLEGRPPTFQGR